MVSPNRVRELEQYVEDWEKALESVTEIRSHLLRDREIGLTLTDDHGNDLLQDRINQADNAVKVHDVILIRMTARRDRARNGEDV